ATDELHEVGHGHRSAKRISADDRETAGEDQAHPRAGLPHPKQELPRAESTQVAEAPDPVDLPRRKDREHLVEPPSQPAVPRWRMQRTKAALRLPLATHLSSRMKDGILS